MKSYQVKEMMVPLSEYATVSATAWLLEAVKALKKAQAAYSRNRYQHRAILVFGKNNHFVGKMSQHDVIMALETRYKELGIKGVIVVIGHFLTMQDLRAEKRSFMGSRIGQQIGVG